MVRQIKNFLNKKILQFSVNALKQKALQYLSDTNIPFIKKFSLQLSFVKLDCILGLYLTNIINIANWLPFLPRRYSRPGVQPAPGAARRGSQDGGREAVGGNQGPQT